MTYSWSPAVTKFKTEESKWAWLAGYLDGEGCFRIQKRKRKGDAKISFVPRLSVYSTDKKILEQVHFIIGGGCLNGPYVVNGTQDRWGYYASSNLLRNCLPMIEPFLITKRKQVKILMEALDLLKWKGNTYPRKRPIKIHLRLLEITEELSQLKNIGGKWK